MSNDLNYSQRDLLDLKNSPAFIDWRATLIDRLESMRRQLEVSGKETVIIRDQHGIATNYVFGHDYLQGAIAEIRFALALTDIQEMDLKLTQEESED